MHCAAITSRISHANENMQCEHSETEGHASKLLHLSCVLFTHSGQCDCIRVNVNVSVDVNVTQAWAAAFLTATRLRKRKTQRRNIARNAQYKSSRKSAIVTNQLHSLLSDLELSENDALVRVRWRSIACALHSSAWRQYVVGRLDESRPALLAQTLPLGWLVQLPQMLLGNRRQSMLQSESAFVAQRRGLLRGGRAAGVPARWIAQSSSPLRQLRLRYSPIGGCGAGAAQRPLEVA